MSSQGQNHPNIQAMAALPHTHAHRTIMAQHQLAIHPAPAACITLRAEGAPSSHLGGHHHTKAGVNLLTLSPGKITLPVLDPRCPRPCHACHHPHAGGPGLRGSHTCHKRAWQPHLRPRTRRTGHHAQWTLPSPPRRQHRAHARGLARAPLPPARRRARPAAAAATATSILGSPRPLFTNAASAGRRRRREGRLRPPGDAASFT
ncbi:hypothetical protein NN561_004286 [Cricetulus griseus]